MIPPPELLVFTLWGLLLQLRLCLLDPVGDDLVFLCSGRLADLLDERVFSFFVSPSVASVTSSNLVPVFVSPCGGVHVP